MSQTTSIPRIWIFNGENSAFPSGAFSDLNQAEAWIAQHLLSGLLTQNPVGSGAYDYAIAQGHFTPKHDDQRAPAFIAKFSSAGLEHHHYINGKRES